MSRLTHFSVFILCGGKSSRMNTDKGLVRFQGQSFVRRIIKAASPFDNPIHLITENPGYLKYGHPLIADRYKGKGPVGGIHAALHYTATEHNLILSCDIPLITTETLQHLLTQFTPGHGVHYLSDGANDYPLVGVYSKKTKDIFTEALNNNTLRLQEVIKKTNPNRIVVDEAYHHSLRNINSPEDLKILENI